mmetsp:Transcript_2163/g.4543  ORF Transcript_2163/g.4543 Transcript_2163/m.4543 type:complete len:328 (-) Transcript_2163:284-1267(-)
MIESAFLDFAFGMFISVIYVLNSRKMPFADHCGLIIKVVSKLCCHILDGTIVLTPVINELGGWDCDSGGETIDIAIVSSTNACRSRGHLPCDGAVSGCSAHRRSGVGLRHLESFISEPFNEGSVISVARYVIWASIVGWASPIVHENQIIGLNDDNVGTIGRVQRSLGGIVKKVVTIIVTGIISFSAIHIPAGGWALILDVIEQTTIFRILLNPFTVLRFLPDQKGVGIVRAGPTAFQLAAVMERVTSLANHFGVGKISGVAPKNVIPTGDGASSVAVGEGFVNLLEGSDMVYVFAVCVYTPVAHIERVICIGLVSRHGPINLVAIH